MQSERYARITILDIRQCALVWPFALIDHCCLQLAQKVWGRSCSYCGVGMRERSPIHPSIHSSQCGMFDHLGWSRTSCSYPHNVYMSNGVRLVLVHLAFSKDHTSYVAWTTLYGGFMHSNSSATRVGYYSIRDLPFSVLTACKVSPRTILDTGSYM